jgi:hypothetical protein
MYLDYGGKGQSLSIAIDTANLLIISSQFQGSPDGRQVDGKYEYAIR